MEISILSNDIPLEKFEKIVAQHFQNESISTHRFHPKEDGSRNIDSILNIVFSDASYAAFAITLVYDLTKFALKYLVKSSGDSSKVVLVLKDDTEVEISKTLGNKEINKILSTYLKKKKVKSIIYK